MKASLFLVMGIAVLLGGCATIGSNGSFRENGLPKQEYYVGGGFMIDYRPVVSGTAYLVEENSGKLIGTGSINIHNPFDFDIDPRDEDIHMRLKTLGIDPLNLKFSLYFVPDEQNEPEAEGGE